MDILSYNQKINNIMGGSKRRSRLGLGVSFFAPSSSFSILGNSHLDTIEMVSNAQEKNSVTEFLGSGKLPADNR